MGFGKVAAFVVGAGVGAFLGYTAKEHITIEEMMTGNIMRPGMGMKMEKAPSTSEDEGTRAASKMEHSEDTTNYCRPVTCDGTHSCGHCHHEDKNESHGEKLASNEEVVKDILTKAKQTGENAYEAAKDTLEKVFPEETRKEVYLQACSGVAELDRLIKEIQGRVMANDKEKADNTEDTEEKVETRQVSKAEFNRIVAEAEEAAAKAANTDKTNETVAEASEDVAEEADDTSDEEIDNTDDTEDIEDTKE